MSSESNAIRRQGDDWIVTFRGGSVRVRDSKGVGYVRQLVASPFQEVHVIDLLGVSGPDAAIFRSDAGPVIDRKARDAYRARLVELEAERDEARDWGDLERAARAEEEMAFVTGELTAAYGISGRPRRANDPTERLRKAVSNRIRHTLTKIEAAHPELGRHLANSVRTGTFCVYAPEVPVEWNL